MEPQKLKKLRKRVDTLRHRGGIKPRELEALAKALGRKRHPRGSEPTWISEVTGCNPMHIPHHSTDLNKITARKILDQLEADIDKIEGDGP